MQYVLAKWKWHDADQIWRLPPGVKNVCDMRPRGAHRRVAATEGFALARYPEGHTLPEGSVALSHGLQQRMQKQESAELAARLNVEAADLDRPDTSDTLWALITTLADPLSRDRVAPIMPSSGGYFNFLGRQEPFDKSKHLFVRQRLRRDYAMLPVEDRLHWLAVMHAQFGYTPAELMPPSGGAASINDDFSTDTIANYTLTYNAAMLNGYSVTGGVLQFLVDGTDSGIRGVARHDTVLDSTDHSSEITGVTMDAGSTAGYGPAVRVTAFTDLYYIQARPVTNEDIGIRKRTSSTDTELDNATPGGGVAPTDKLKLSITGSTLTSFQNDVDVTASPPVTDSDHASAVRAGIYSRVQTTGTNTHDDFEALALGGGGSTTAPSALVLGRSRGHFRGVHVTTR